MPRLVISGRGGEVVHEFPNSEVVLGSDAACDIVVTGADVSPEHCKLQPVMGAWKIVDLESDAGTRVNGAYVNQRPVRNGDVLELGEVRIVFQEDAATAAPAAATRAPSGRASRSSKGSGASKGSKARSGGARRSAPPARRAAPAQQRRSAPPRGRDAHDDYDDGEEKRPSRRPRKKSNNGQTIALTIGAVVILFGLGYMVLSPTTSPNEQVLMRMQSAEGKMDWQAVLSESQAGDVTDPMYGERIAALKAKAEQQVKNDAARERIPEATDAFNDLRLWRQDDNWKNDEEYVRRIDAYLAEYADLGGAGVEEVRATRARLTGSSAAGEASDAKDAWSRLLADLSALKKNGQFGQAIAKTEEYRTKWSASDPVRGREAAAMQTSLHSDAKKWVGLQISKAQQKMDYGAPLQARKILERAMKSVGIPEFEERAAKALSELGK